MIRPTSHTRPLSAAIAGAAFGAILTALAITTVKSPAEGTVKSPVIATIKLPVEETRSQGTNDSATLPRPVRFVYLDLGVNWGTTSRLFRDVAFAQGPWEVYGFEAFPLMMPFGERWFRYLNGLEPAPEYTLPRTGSSGHLRAHYKSLGCTDKPCALRKLLAHPELPKIIYEDSKFLDPQLVQSRLAEAATPNRNAGARYTFVPAAATDHDGHLTLKASIENVFYGGASPAIKGREFTTTAVDLVSWIRRHFTSTDVLVAKFDIEGSEVPILERMLQDGSIQMLDVLLWDCHRQVHKSGPDLTWLDLMGQVYSRARCAELQRNLQAVPGLRILREDVDYVGYDDISRQEDPIFKNYAYSCHDGRRDLIPNENATLKHRF